MNYYYKYIKYKTKYQNLKKNIVEQKGGNKEKIFFIHSTTNYDNLIKILETNKIKISSQVEKERRNRTSGNVNFIFGNIYFSSVNNLTHLPDYTLILSDKLLKKYDIRFNKGWTGNEILTINHKDNYLDKKEKLEKVKNFLENPLDLPEKLRDPSGLMNHEILINKNIPIKKYLIGIICNNCNDEQIKEIKKYVNIPIFKNNLVPDIY